MIRTAVPLDPNNGADPPDEATEQVTPSRNSDVVHAVRHRVAFLQQTSTQERRFPGSVAALARLRNAVGRSPGSVSDVWDDTIGLLAPEWLGHQAEPPRPAENAVHHAMTAFALHRQGSTRAAHVTNVRFGTAIRRLSRHRSIDGTEAESVRRRFDGLLTASSPDEGAHHLRGLVRLLKSEDIGLDYGLLAADLIDLWTPARADAVRLKWAREYRRDKGAALQDGTTAADTATDRTSGQDDRS